jgi:hypothetical protein
MKTPSRSMLMCLLVGAMLSLSLAPAAVARTHVYVGAYKIINVGTGRCLDAFYDYGGGNGNPVGLFDCNGGITEKWHIWRDDSARSGETFEIRNARNFRSLDYLGDNTLGRQYKLWRYYGGFGEMFYVTSPAADHSRMVGVARAPDGVMDAFQVDGGGNGNRVGVWYPTGSPLQHWWFKCVHNPCELPGTPVVHPM